MAWPELAGAAGQEGPEAWGGMLKNLQERHSQQPSASQRRIRRALAPLTPGRASANRGDENDSSMRGFIISSGSSNNESESERESSSGMESTGASAASSDEDEREESRVRASINDGSRRQLSTRIRRQVTQVVGTWVAH